MTLYDVKWAANGCITVEADDAEEAEELVTEAINDFDTVMLDAISVDDVEVTDTRVKDEDKDE